MRSAHLIRLSKAALDLAVLGAAYCLAFLVRFEGSLNQQMLERLAATLPIVLAVQLLCLVAFRVRRLSWQHIGLAEARLLLTSLGLATAMLLLWRIVTGLAGITILQSPFLIPFGILLMDLPLSILGIVGLRVVFREWVERTERAKISDDRPKIRSILLGTGRPGVLVAKEIAAGRDTGIQALGFVDENPDHIGSLIHGLPILGSIGQLAEIVKKHAVEQALITMENTSGQAIRTMVRLCEDCGITAKIIPEIWEMVEGKFNLAAIRDVAIEDLLKREPVSLDCEAISEVVRNRVVLISGAGGSIGSELCRVVCRFEPATLILVEQAENNLFFIHRELRENFPQIDVVPCVADICDAARIRSVFADYQPAIVFHAAAHKHVPMMEWNPGEAVKNNVLGTKAMADLAHEFAVSEFVMISTDKAVNPSSVMGVSKRVAEIYIQALSQRSQTRFVAVRFGNVLGSAGSVIPIFKQQIAAGGPVTVTHPAMKRYFMTIPEACQLVLQAASMGQGGEIFILDMGEPIKIVDLARDLIRLSGLQPDKDIEIHFTGIRPGEKLFEELSLDEEGAERTRHYRIFVGRIKAQDWHHVNRQIKQIGELAGNTDPHVIHAKFKEIVPEYQNKDWEKIATDSYKDKVLRYHERHNLGLKNGKIKVVEA